MKPVPGIMDISPYVGGRATSDGQVEIFKLSSNESPLGPSPKAIEAFIGASKTLHLYPDGGATVLRKTIAAKFGLDIDAIVCGNGSDELLHLLPQIYANPGDEIIYSQHGFLVYRIAALAASAIPLAAPEPNLNADIDQILSCVSERTKIVFIANPNNPTGSYLSKQQLTKLRNALPSECLLVVDAAYAEYATPSDYDDGLELAKSCTNTVMTRTFSKIHGLASLRVGWAVSSTEIIGTINRVRGPFNVSTPAQMAAAAALGDEEHIRRSQQHNLHWRTWLQKNIAMAGFNVFPSEANFLLVEFPKIKGKTALDADRFLMSHGVILRPVGAYGLPDCLRISVGTEKANVKAVELLREFIK